MSTGTSQSKSQTLLSPKPEDTRASLCIYKDELVPDKISELLDLKPTIAQTRGGQKFHSNNDECCKSANVGGWVLSTHESVKNLNPQHHIQWLVDMISNRHSVIHKLQEEGYRIEIWVYWLATCSNASPTLSPELMRKLANLRIPIVFDVYF